MFLESARIYRLRDEAEDLRERLQAAVGRTVNVSVASLDSDMMEDVRPAEPL